MAEAVQWIAGYSEYAAQKRTGTFRFPAGEEFKYVLGNNPKAQPPVRTQPSLVQDFIIYVADSLNYSVEFAPYSINVELVDLKQYVSWLVVTVPATTTQRGFIHVVFDPDKVDGELGTENNRIFKEKLAKIFLHECSHAVKHLPYLKQKRGEEALPKQEKEAWVLGLCMWAILIGAAAEWWRHTPEQTDFAWILA